MDVSYRQGGWVGLIVLLLALMVVALLAQTVLKQYGLLPGTARPVTAQGSRVPGGIAPMPLDVSSPDPTPGNAIERARGVESMMRQDAANRDKDIDAATK